tara:strand:- start:317 stop:445 length:129 start_codon:yes stop_codon:yes gene_type:complete
MRGSGAEGRADSLVKVIDAFFEELALAAFSFARTASTERSAS